MFKSRRRAFKRGHLAYIPWRKKPDGTDEYQLFRRTKRGKLIPYSGW